MKAIDRSFATRLLVMLSLFITSGLLTHAQTVAVANVEELYAAVNDPGNTGSTVVLAPGTYMLSVNGPGGMPRPNGGRLELQEDMSIQGVIDGRDLAVIDAIGLPAASLAAVGGVPTGAIRVGRGSNSIEWLTVRNARSGQGNIVSGLPYAGTPRIRVAHVVSSGASNNLSVLNWGTAGSGKTVEVDVVDCDLHSATVSLRQGFRIGNFSGAVNGTVNVRMSGNRIYNNQFSLVVNNGAINSTINIFSSGNRYFDNGLGLLLTGGLNANGNTTNFEGHGDRFFHNTGPSNLTDTGGLMISGGEDFNQLIPNTANNNAVNVSLFGCRLYGNQFADLAGYGARTVPNPLIGNPGVNNRATVTLQGTGNQHMVEDFQDVIPADPATTNSVTVIR